jgi:hypothetical protein
MAIEIEKAAISFTDEAELALNRSISRLERRVRARAADLAIKSRGTPAEVTGSDIERAYRDILRPTPGEPLEEKVLSNRRLRKSHMLHFVSTVYVWLGVVTAIVGGLYPYVQARLANPTFRLSTAITLTGLALSGLGLLLREYTHQRELIRKEETTARSRPS